MDNKRISNGLDYNIENASDRVKKVDELLKEHDSDLIAYFDEYYNPSLNQNASLSEHDKVCKDLETMADYILFADDKEQKDILKKNRIHKINKREFASKDVVNLLNDGGTTIEKKNIRKSPDYKVKEADRLKYKELHSMAVAIGYLKFCNDNGFKPDDRISENEYLKMAGMGRSKIVKMASMFEEDYISSNKLTYDEKRLYKKTEINLRKEEVVMSKILHGYFTFNDRGTTCITLDDNTGYYNEDGEYVEVTDNKVDMNNPKHIYELIKLYPELKEYTYEKLNSNTRFMMDELDSLIAMSNLDDYEREIVVMLIDKIPQAEMLKVLKEDFNIEISQPRLSQIVNSIMNKISSYGRKQFKEWAYNRFDLIK